MNKIDYITATFIQYDKHDYNSDCYYRILTNVDTFYFAKSQFRHQQVLDELKQGDTIHLAANPLQDGTYWLHWLISERQGTLEITQSIKLSILQKLSLIVYTLVFFLLSIGYKEMLTVILKLAAIPLSVCILMLIIKCITFNLPKMRQLRKYFIRAKHGDFTFIQDRRNHNRQSPPLPIIALPSIEETVQNVGEVSYLYNKLTINFKISDTFISVREYLYYQLNILIPYFYWNMHPIFIANGDQLKLVLDNGKIKAIVNRTDHATYLFCNSAWFSKTKAKIMLIYVYTILISAYLVGIPALFFTINLDFSLYFKLLIFLLPLPFLVLAIQLFISTFGNKFSTKLTQSWLLKITKNKQSIEIFPH